jgi:hypothetical protein
MNHNIISINIEFDKVKSYNIYEAVKEIIEFLIISCINRFLRIENNLILININEIQSFSSVNGLLKSNEIHF